MMAKTKVDLNGKTILVTGSPGFIGANLVIRLLQTLTSGTVVSLAKNAERRYDPKAPRDEVQRHGPGLP